MRDVGEWVFGKSERCRGIGVWEERDVGELVFGKSERCRGVGVWEE